MSGAAMSLTVLIIGNKEQLWTNFRINNVPPQQGQPGGTMLTTAFIS
jgi:hypothetical protein